MADVKKLIKNEIERLKKQKDDIEEMNKIKKMEFVKAALTITVKDKFGKEIDAVFGISNSLAKETLEKDIKEDSEKLERIEKNITKKENQL